MKLKKLLVIVLSFVCISLFSGCAEIQYIRTVDDFGAVLDRIVVDLDTDELKAKYNNDITFNNAFRKLKDEIHTDFQLYEKAVNEWKSTFKYNENLYNLVNQGITMFITHNFESPDVDVMTLEIKFSNSGLFLLFYGSEVTYNGKPLQVESIMKKDFGPYVSDDVVKELQNYTPFLYKQNIVESESFTKDLESETYLKSNTKSYFDRYKDEMNFGELFTVEDVDFSTIYASTNERLYTNAEDVLFESGLYHHYWSLDQDSSMKFYGVVPNLTSWYLIALAIAVVVIIGLLLYCKKDVVFKKIVKLRASQKPENDFDDDDDLGGNK